MDERIELLKKLKALGIYHYKCHEFEVVFFQEPIKHDVEPEKFGQQMTNMDKYEKELDNLSLGL